MTFLELCQRLHREAVLPGNGPSAVTGQTGQNQRTVDWIKDAWIDIQNMDNSGWRWMRHAFRTVTVADQAEYSWNGGESYDLTEDATGATAIARFKRWRLTDRRNPPRIYLASVGAGNDSILSYWTWDRFVYTWNRGNINAGKPTIITIDPQDRIVLAPKPDAVYHVVGEFYVGAQSLAADGDIPECPADFHMAIVWKAMIDFGFGYLAQERIMQAERRLPEVLGPLITNQAESMRFGMAPPLA